MKRVVQIIVILFMIVLSCSVAGQQKYEREYRIAADDLPAQALKFIESLNMEGKIKWYVEESLAGQSVEAKFKHQGKKYSIEFDISGNLQDVEIEIQPKEIPENIWAVISGNLSADLRNHKIKKIQVQFTGERSAILDYLTGGPDSAGISTRYEIEVSGKRDKKTRMYEYTFVESGDVEHVREIVPRSLDILEF